MIQPEKLRIPVIFLLGLFYVFGTPIFESADEPAHFARAYGLAEGQIVLRDHPSPLIAFIFQNLQAHTSDQTRAVVRYLEKYAGLPVQERIPNIAYNAALYSPIPYLPFALVIRMATGIWDSGDAYALRYAFYGCRMISLIIFCILLSIVFRISALFSWPFFNIASLPMALSLAGSISLDPLLLTSVMLVLALSWSNLQNMKIVIGFWAASIGIVSTKPPYVPVLFSALLPMVLGRKDRQKGLLRIVLMSILLSLVCTGIWQYVVNRQDVWHSSRDFVDHIVPGLQFDLRHQALLFLKSPSVFFRMVYTEIILHAGQWFREMIGVLGWLNIAVPKWIPPLWMLMATASAFLHPENGKLSVRQKTVVAAGYAAIMALAFIGIMLSAFLIWVPVGGSTIPIQGRYLQPILACFLAGLTLVVGGWGASWNPQWIYILKLGSLTLSVIINVASILTVILHYQETVLVFSCINLR